jgi:hypothetical protein
MNVFGKLGSLVLCVATLPLYVGSCMLPNHPFTRVWENELKRVAVG